MYIFDTIRRKWLVLTPEEWVRQHVLNHLVSEKKVPASIISVEKEIILYEQRKRYDIVVYDRDNKPWLVVECKAPYVELDESTVDQALRYNHILQAPYLMISNGVSDVVFNIAGKQIDLPCFAAD